MSLEMAHKVILPPKKNYIPQFLKQRDINSYFSQMFQTYSELYLTVPPPHCKLPPERDGPGILICSCVTCRKILDLKK
jgi:hypothetical protein